MSQSSEFALALCQPGMEAALKAEVTRMRPDLHAGFQRPGLVTFKTTKRPFRASDAPPVVFARMWAASAGPCRTVDAVIATGRELEAVAAWVAPRDAGEDAPPAVIAAIEAEVARWRAALAPHFRGSPGAKDVVLDVIVAPGEPPVVGWHEHGPARHEGPGGRFEYPIPDDIPSRAWRKVVEGLQWSKAPIRRGELVLELGAAPGGGTRAFAEAGLRVLAVDPQPLDPKVVAMPGVTVVARRAGDLKLGDLPNDVRWLASDAGIPPNDVLRAIERLRPALPNLRGFLLTLKLNDPGVVKHLPQTFNDLKALGATEVHARQLPANRRDVFVYAPVGRG